MAELAIHDFLLVIMWPELYLTPFLKPPHPNLSPNLGDFFQTYLAKRGTFVYFVAKTAWSYAAVLSQYIRVTYDDDDRQQTTYRNNSLTLRCSCNVELKTQKKLYKELKTTTKTETN